jgi:hypothetical protein
MNDFTKEELKDIRTFMEAYLYDYKVPLWVKVNNMIDNYCDHYWENPCCGCPDSASRCTKCNKAVHE